MKAKQQDKFPKQITLTINDEETRKVLEGLMLDPQLGLGTPQNVVRYVLGVGLSSNPQAAAMVSGRSQAYQDTQVFIHGEVSRFLSGLKATLEGRRTGG